MVVREPYASGQLQRWRELWLPLFYFWLTYGFTNLNALEVHLTQQAALKLQLAFLERERPPKF